MRVHGSSSRRVFLAAAATALSAPALVSRLRGAGGAPFRSRSQSRFVLEEATLESLQAGLGSGQLTSAGLVRLYLDRIAALDRTGPVLASVLELNPEALAIARGLDRERRRQGPRSLLHGIPILVKDNIDTAGRMTTTAGSLALAGSIAARDAFVVERLRAAGAIVLGKTNLSEWANFRGSRSSSGWSARGGQTRNPYVLDRNPSGSSSGSAVAVSANLCAVAVGTETDGSIISPASLCGIVGLKPTVGLVSRSGIIPISHSQDTAGPMTRTVRDAAIVLGVMAGPDPRDAATAAASAAGAAGRDYLAGLGAAPNVAGLRVGVLRRTFEALPAQAELLAATLAALGTAGVALVDPVECPRAPELGPAEFEVMLYECKAGLNTYLGGLGPSAPIHSLRELIEFNRRNAARELAWFGQETLELAEAKGPLTDPAYLKAVATCRRLAREEGIDGVLEKHRLDAFLSFSGGPAAVRDPVYGDRGSGGSTSPSAPAGYPCLTVPAGFVRELPVGIAFFGPAWSEPTLLQLGWAVEQASRRRQPPRFLPSLDSPPP